MVLSVILLIGVYIAATYRDYSDVFKNKVYDRDTTILIGVHHDGIPHETSISDIQRQHKDINGWESGFAYTFYLKDGKVYQMRPLNANTPHAFGYNENSVSVCVHTPDKYRLRTRINLYLTILSLKVWYGFTADQIKGHGELDGNSTDCPDMNMDSLRAMFFDLKTMKWMK